ncbi:hypothetical protein KA977_09215 [Candidatus Dependentiae bacterium]|nr:hypothetical protein [Candidatus Dependentiae bacterium]
MPAAILSANKTKALIGDTIVLKLNIKFAENIDEINPVFPEKKIGVFDIYDIQTVYESKTSKTFTIVIAPFHISETSAVIPPINVEYKNKDNRKTGVISSNSIQIELEDIKFDSKKWIKNLEKPVLKKYDYSGIIVVLTIIFILIFFVIMVRYILKKRMGIEKKYSYPEEEYSTDKIIELCIKELEKIKNRRVMDISDYKLAAFDLSFLLRKLLSGFFKTDCMELSNSELKIKFEQYSFSKKYLFFEILDELETIKFSSNFSADTVKIKQIFDNSFIAISSLKGIKNES